MAVTLDESLDRSLGHIRFHPGIVQQATGRNAETKSRPITTTNLPSQTIHNQKFSYIFMQERRTNM
jgi:hypothetical protein